MNTPQIGLRAWQPRCAQCLDAATLGTLLAGLYRRAVHLQLGDLQQAQFGAGLMPARWCTART
jgi:hypothetical protein